MLSRFDPPTADSIWNTTSNNNAPTEFHPFTGVTPGAFAPGAAPARGTAPFGVTPPATSVPPPGGPLPSLPPYRPLPTAPGRKGWGKTLALAIVAAVLLLAVIGGGLLLARSFNKAPAGATTSPQATAAASSPTASPTPTQLPTTAYRNPGGLFSIRYPGSWTQADFSPSNVPFPLPLNGVRFGGGQAEFVILTGQEPPLMPTNGLAVQADNALLGTMNAQHISGPRSVKIGGQSWTEKSADTSGGKHTVIASISFNQHLYSLWYSAPASDFSANEQQFFNPMVASFSFGG